MVDKSWMLNTKAISAAKKCVSIIESELGIRLKLANPDFLQLITQYAELNNSPELERAVLTLAQYAPADVQVSMTIGGDSDSKIVNLEDGTKLAKTSSEPSVNYRGKEYPRYRDGGEFQGLYRGQPRYV